MTQSERHRQRRRFPCCCVQYVMLILLSTTLQFIGLCQGDDDELTLTVTVARSEVHSGDNVTLICRVQGASENARFEWYKSTVAPNGGVGGGYRNEELIASNDELAVLYSRQPGERYDVQAVRLPEVTLYILHIYLVKHEDSGSYRCAMLYGGQYKQDPDTVSLLIYKRPTAVYFDGYPDGSELTVIEDVPTTLTCHVSEVLPQPHVSIHVHHRSLGNHIPRNVSVNVRCPPSAAGSGRGVQKVPPAEKLACGPVHYDLDVAVKTSQLTATHRDDGHRVTCSVNLASANWTPADTSIYLNVKYRPRFNCSQSLSVLLGARDVTLRCRLRYNPRPSLLSVRWQLHDEVDVTTVDVGTSIADQYRLDEAVVDVTTWKETELIFVISQVRKEHFGVYYHFDAANDIGSSTHGIRLLQLYPPRSSTVPTTLHRQHTTKSGRPPPDSLPLHPNGSAQHVGSVTACASRRHLPVTNVTTTLLALILVVLFTVDSGKYRRIPHR